MTAFYSEQARYKQLVTAKEGKYKMLARSKEGRQTERQRQLSKLRSLQSVVEKIKADFPATQEYLNTVATSLSARLSCS